MPPARSKNNTPPQKNSFWRRIRGGKARIKKKKECIVPNMYSPLCSIFCFEMRVITLNFSSQLKPLCCNFLHKFKWCEQAQKNSNWSTKIEGCFVVSQIVNLYILRWLFVFLLLRLMFFCWRVFIFQLISSGKKIYVHFLRKNWIVALLNNTFSRILYFKGKVSQC